MLCVLTSSTAFLIGWSVCSFKHSKPLVSISETRSLISPDILTSPTHGPNLIPPRPGAEPLSCSGGPGPRPPALAQRGLIHGPGQGATGWATNKNSFKKRGVGMNKSLSSTRRRHHSLSAISDHHCLGGAGPPA